MDVDRSPDSPGRKWRFVAGKRLAFAIFPVAMVAFLGWAFQSGGAVVVGGGFVLFTTIWIAAGLARAYDQGGG